MMNPLKYVGKGILYGLGFAAAIASIVSADTYLSKKTELDNINSDIKSAQVAQESYETQKLEYADGKAIRLVERNTAGKKSQFDKAGIERTLAENQTIALDESISKTYAALSELDKNCESQKSDYLKANDENKRLEDELKGLEGTLKGIEQQAVDSKKNHDDTIVSIIGKYCDDKKELEKDHAQKMKDAQNEIVRYEGEILQKLMRKAYNDPDLNLRFGKPVCGYDKKELDKRACRLAEYLTKQGFETDLADAIIYWSDSSAKEGAREFEVLKSVYEKDPKFAGEFKALQPVYEDAVTEQKLWLVKGILDYYDNWGNKELEKINKDDSKDNAKHKSKLEDKVFRSAIWHAGQRNPDGSGTVGIYDAINQNDLVQKLNAKDNDSYNDADNLTRKVIFDKMKYSIRNSDRALAEFMSGFFNSFSMGVIPEDSPLQELREKWKRAEPYLTEEQKNALKGALAKKFEHMEKTRKESKGLLGTWVYGITYPVRFVGDCIGKAKIPVVSPVLETAINAAPNAAQETVDIPQHILMGNAYERGKGFGAAAITKVVEEFKEAIKELRRKKGETAVETRETQDSGIGGGQGGGDEFGSK